MDVLVEARRRLTDSAAASYDQQRATHTPWWHGLWSRSFVQATSADGVADFLERMRNYHLYVLGCSSRGRCRHGPRGCSRLPKGRRCGTASSGCGTWTTNIKLLRGGPFDLLEPFFTMYSRWLRTAKSPRGSGGGCRARSSRKRRRSTAPRSCRRTWPRSSRM